MSLSAATDGDAERSLRALAAIAYDHGGEQPWLAATVLRRARRSRRRRLIVGSCVAGTVLVGSVAAATVGGGPYYEHRQPSAVMEPTVRVGESVVVNRDLDPQRLDVVHLDLRVDGGEIDTLLRVIGTAGDTVACPATGAASCAVTVNGTPLRDQYVAALSALPFDEVTVPEGSLFVLGDARDVAVDSRSLGPVRDDDVRGVVVAVVSDGGKASTVAGAPRHHVPDDYQVDPEAPVPPASTG